MSKNPENLFNEFPPVSTEEWEKIIEKDLRGSDYKQKLKWETGEGFDILPFYRREDIQKDRPKTPIRIKESGNPWHICFPVYEQDIKAARQSALNALQRGADALQFRVQVRSTSGALGGDLEGTSLQNQEAFTGLLEDINLQHTSLVFDSGMASPIMLAMLLNAVPENLQVDSISSVFSYDPFVYIAQRGQLPMQEKLLRQGITDLVRATTEAGNIRALGADGRLWHNAGGTIVQELGFSLAAASEYMAWLTENGINPDQAAASISFFLAAGSKYFPEIAKFRALRLLWKQLLDAYNADNNIPAYIHAETSTWNKTVYDPYVNMLRSTTEGMSAAIGGIDSLTLHPFDHIFREPEDFSERIARNFQIILQEEAYFNKVSDPSAGSYYIEKLTDKIASESWKVFREVEREGGLLKAIRNGTIQSAIESEQEKRDKEIATRGRVFVGTNQYPDAEEQITKKDGNLSGDYATVSLQTGDTKVELFENGGGIVENIQQALDEGAALGDLVPELFREDWSKQQFRVVTPYRGTQAFEKLRMATENYPETPSVMTLPMGNRKMRKARSTFTANFFGCAGYRIIDPIGFDSSQQAVEAITEEKPDIVVLCGSDSDYKELVPELCDSLDKLDSKPVTVLAGYPKDSIEAYRKAGIEEFIHAGSNVLQTLKNFHQKLGIITDESE